MNWSWINVKNVKDVLFPRFLSCLILHNFLHGWIFILNICKIITLRGHTDSLCQISLRWKSSNTNVSLVKKILLVRIILRRVVVCVHIKWMSQAHQRGIASKFTFRCYSCDLCSVYVWIEITERMDVAVSRITFVGLSTFQRGHKLPWLSKSSDKSHWKMCFLSSDPHKYHHLYIKGLLLVYFCSLFFFSLMRSKLRRYHITSFYL